MYDANKNGAGKKPEITEGHFTQVVKMSTAFKNYIKSAQMGKDPEDLAYDHGNRNDHYRSNTA